MSKLSNTYRTIMHRCIEAHACGTHIEEALVGGRADDDDWVLELEEGVVGGEEEACRIHELVLNPEP